MTAPIEPIRLQLNQPPSRSQSQIPIDPELEAESEDSQMLLQAMTGSSASFLVTDEIVPLSFNLPDPIYGQTPPISPFSQSLSKAPKAKTITGLSRQVDTLQAELAARTIQNQRDRDTINQLNAQLVVSNLYSRRVQVQMLNGEKKKNRKRGVRLVATNGFANYLTHSSLIEAAKEVRQQLAQKEAAEQHRANITTEWKAWRVIEDKKIAAWTKKKAEWKEAGGTGKYHKRRPGKTSREAYREIYESFYDITAADDDDEDVEGDGSDDGEEE